MKHDHAKIILVGVALVLFVFLLLFVSCAILVGNIGIAALVAVGGTVLLANVYAILAVKYPDKLGLATVAAHDLKNAGGRYECVLCGVTTTLSDVFRPDPRAVGSQSGLVCPSCYVKRQAAIHSVIGLAYIGMAALGITLVIIHRDSRLGAGLLNIVLFYLLILSCVIPHELGHALAAALVGFRVFVVSIGIGKTLFARKVCGVRLEVKAIPASGFVFSATPSPKLFRLRLFIIILAGPLANLLIILLLLARVSWGSIFAGFPDRVSPVAALLLANLTILAISLWPYTADVAHYRLPSDGLSLWSLPFMKQDKVGEVQAMYYAVEGAECLRDDDLDGARKWFTQGLAAFPDNVPCLHDMGVLWVELGDFEQARQVFERLLQKTDLDAKLRVLVQNNLAYSCARLGGEFLLEADRLSREVYDRASWVVPYRRTRGTVLVELGRLDEGIALLKQAMAEQEELSGKAWTAGYLAIAYGRKGDKEQAEKYYETAKLLDPRCKLLPRVREETGAT